ncbi:hypothetical protein BC332_09651 [Capsicum chinense]|nr:hypothetical protein BC332_09651 [Capsicum chinense]
MNGAEGQLETAFEIGVVVPKSSGNCKDGDEDTDCVEVLVEEFRKAGLIVDRVVGLQNEFIRQLVLEPAAARYDRKHGGHEFLL